MTGAEIRKLRDKLKLTQKELATRLRVDAITISKWEHNEQKPSNLAGRQLARLFGKV